jgi:hypothetical protein
MTETECTHDSSQYSEKCSKKGKGDMKEVKKGLQCVVLEPALNNTAAQYTTTDCSMTKSCQLPFTYKLYNVILLNTVILW